MYMLVAKFKQVAAMQFMNEFFEYVSNGIWKDFVSHVNFTSYLRYSIRFSKFTLEKN